MGWAETAAFGYLRERLVGTAGPQGTFGYRGADFRSRSIDGTAEIFFGNPGNLNPKCPKLNLRAS
jgi:hypothetical protein